jgi:hypothetical protein
MPALEVALPRADALGARGAGTPRETHIFAMIASPNSLHFTSFAPSICRAKS